MKLSKIEVINYLSVITALLAIVSLLVLFVATVPIGRTHPDDFYLGRLFLDLYYMNGDWNSWVPPSAPSFFPDGLIYGIISVFTLDISKVSYMYAAVIGILTSLLLYSFFLYFGLERSCSALAVMLVFLGFLFFGEKETFWSEPSQHFLSYFNFFLCSLFFIRSNINSRLWVIYFLLVIVSVVSDYLLIPLLSAGISGMLVASILQNRISVLKGIKLEITLIASVSIGAACYWILIPNPQGNPVWASGISVRDAMTSISPHLSALLVLLKHMTSNIFIAAILIATVALLSNRHDKKLTQKMIRAFALITSAILANAYIVGLGADWSTTHKQYSIFILNGEITLVALSIAYLAQSRKVLILLTQCSIVAVALSSSYHFDTFEKRSAPYSQLVKDVNCVTQVSTSNGLKNGLAAFVDSDRYTLISKGKIRLNTLLGNKMQTKHYVLSKAWSEDPAGFVLVRNNVDPEIYEEKRIHYPLSKEIVVQDLGEPDKVYNCESTAILIYDRQIECKKNKIATHNCDSLF